MVPFRAVFVTGTPGWGEADFPSHAMLVRYN